MLISNARENSAFWRATEAGTPNIARFFLKAARPDYLADAPGGAAYLERDRALVELGRTVFADTCARCHSSKQPRPSRRFIEEAGGPDYLTGFTDWWHWTQTDEYKSAMRALAARPDFLSGNYLSTEVRIPQTLLRTNMCSPLASNAIRGNIWDNFSSESYKDLPSVGQSSYQDPFTGAWKSYAMPAGGRGYTRPPSLISLWSSAPFLLNNTVGTFNGDPSVAGRMAAFDDAIVKMLWPERRERDTLTPGIQGLIDRTTAQSFIYVPSSWVPDVPGGERAIRGLLNDRGEIELGPIPKGMPVNLLASLQPLAESKDPAKVLAHYTTLTSALVALKRSLLTAGRGASDDELRAHFAPLRARLMALSKCPDFVVNRGHYFGTVQFNQPTGLTRDERAFGTETPLTDAQKRALIAFLKTV
jgi:hypothetical protein